MSDVREKLILVITAELHEYRGASSTRLADAILERFDVTPKPVITDEEFGFMARKAVLGEPNVEPWVSCLDKAAGVRLSGQLASAGLQIVRVEG